MTVRNVSGRVAVTCSTRSNRSRTTNRGARPCPFCRCMLSSPLQHQRSVAFSNPPSPQTICNQSNKDDLLIHITTMYNKVYIKNRIVPGENQMLVRKTKFHEKYFQKAYQCELLCHFNRSNPDVKTSQRKLKPDGIDFIISYSCAPIP